MPAALHVIFKQVKLTSIRIVQGVLERDELSNSFEYHLNMHISLLHGFDCLSHPYASFCDLILIEKFFNLN